MSLSCLLDLLCSFQGPIPVSRQVAPLSNALGGDNEIRTRDLLRARQALSQLSYTPIWVRYQTLKIEQYEPMTALHVFTCSRSGGSSELLQPLLAKRPIDLGYD